MEDQLVMKIKELNKNNEYDCLLMFSGGKDSSYLLYYLSQILKLRVITVTLTHNFLAEETLSNIESFAKRYSKKHITIENKILNYSARHFLGNWINRPDEGSLVTLCTGCRLGLSKIIIETAKKENINVVVTGLTPFEATDFRVRLVNYPRGKQGKLFFLLGYLRLIVRNPSLLKDIKAVWYQAEEYYYYLNQKKIYKRNKLYEIRPFYHYLKYDESEIIETLKKLNWKKASVSNSSYWRADCNMNAIRQFFYKYVANYNEMEHYYGQMLRDNLISPEYYEKNIKDQYSKDDILNLIRLSDISGKAKIKYEKFLGSAESDNK